jgi:UDP-glucose 4-epimerase
MTAINYRFFNIFGPWQRPDHDYSAVIPKWIWQLINGDETIEVFGDGTHSRDFAFVDSVTSVLLQGLEKKINHPGPLNLAFGNKISLNEVIEELKQHFPKLKVKYLNPRLGDVKISQNDPSELLNVFPGTKAPSFSDAIAETVSWFAENGKSIVGGPKVMD